jgi:hypothetical protein
MRRLVLLAAVVILSCQAVSSFDPPAITHAPPTQTILPTEILPTATAIPEETSVPSPEPDFEVLLHPDGSLYVGDQISMEVIARGGLELDDKQVQIEAAGIQDDQVAAEFTKHGIGKRMQATFNWVWDTSNLHPGDHEIGFSIQPEGPTWTETVHLQPLASLPNPEPSARWETETIECCEIYYISGTEFAQELPNNLEIIQTQAEEAAHSMDQDFEQRIPITILPRVLGHGGFASNEIYVSYLGSNYAGNDLAQVIHHEMVHILDRRLGGELRPSLFVEGLAVYLSDGHFKKEPLMSRAAALVDLGWYLPLTDLADSFYTSQHEIGYLEGGALVDFMINRFGWEPFSNFYRDIHPHSSDSQAKAIDTALQEHFNLTLQQLEGLFTAELHRMHINPDMRADLILTVKYYEAVRRYQRMLDTSAYFLTAWLPSGEEMRERGIVADYLRRPQSPQNLEIVELLVEVDQQIRAGNYLQAEKALDRANKTLDLVHDKVLTGN